jgi:hypothetical protein
MLLLTLEQIQKNIIHQNLDSIILSYQIRMYVPNFIHISPQ